MDGDGHVIGVTQVMNKLHGRVFTEDDVAIIEVKIFLFFCSRLFLFRLFQYSVVWVLIIHDNMKMLFV
jgi:hypothetical protein